MTTTPEYYLTLVDAFGDVESLTVLVVGGRSRAEVAAGLGVDLTHPVEIGWDAGEDATGWALLDIPGGVLAVERTGYGDPSLASLAAVSEAGAAAVVRSNVQAHVRFGCARGGEIVFDDDEYAFIEDPGTVPDELRSLFDLAWDDLDSDAEEDRADPFTIGLAMAEVVTGLVPTTDQVASVGEGPFFRGPSLVYLGADE